MNDLRAEFAKLAASGYLGDPTGQDAYAYLRASSEKQVAEGSSFPRQLESVHKAAKRDKLRISHDLIFFDDGYSGFEFEHRPALLELRHEMNSRHRAAHLVIEDIDRLSRHARWQQGYLLEEFSRRGVDIHFFIQPGSDLELIIRGYMAQEGMKKDIERMRMGSVFKALDGRVTAKRPRYGYIITDPKDSHYEFHSEESRVMRWVYEKLIYEGWTLHRIATAMNDEGIPTRFKNGFWTPSTLYQLVKSPVYKGEFYANRHYQVKTGEFNESGRPKRKNMIRPEDEWIEVKVPQIVSPEEWEMAQEALSRNAKRSMRNSKKRNWLLTGFLKCAICREYTFVAIIGNTKKNPRRYHGCSSRYSQKARLLKTACHSPYVHADELERRVWEEIEQVIYDPHLLIHRLEQREGTERRKVYQTRLNQISASLADLEMAKEKFEAAYQRDIYSLDEFEVKMKQLRAEAGALDEARTNIQKELAQALSLEDQKAVVLAALANIRSEVERARADNKQPDELPQGIKRRVLELLVDVIWVNSETRTFTIEGVIRGTFALDEAQGLRLELPVASEEEGEFAFISTPKWR